MIKRALLLFLLSGTSLFAQSVEIRPAVTFPFSFWKSSVSATPTPTATATATATASPTPTATATATATASPTPTATATATATATPTATATATATATPTATPITLTYVSDGDANGVFYFIGQNYNTGGTWTNPNTAGRLPIVSQSLLGGTYATIVNRAASDTYTNDEGPVDEWFAFDLGAGKSLQLNTWSYRSRTGVNTSLPVELKIFGTNSVSTFNTAGVNAATWTLLDTEDTSGLTSADTWVTSPLSLTSGYRYFKIQQTYPNSSAGGHFTIGEYELYGVFQF